MLLLQSSTRCVLLAVVQIRATCMKTGQILGQLLVLTGARDILKILIIDQPKGRPGLISKAEEKVKNKNFEYLDQLHTNLYSSWITYSMFIFTLTLILLLSAALYVEKCQNSRKVSQKSIAIGRKLYDSMVV